jgi:hypothetical protein
MRDLKKFVKPMEVSETSCSLFDHWVHEFSLDVSSLIVTSAFLKRKANDTSTKNT